MNEYFHFEFQFILIFVTSLKSHNNFSPVKKVNTVSSIGFWVALLGTKGTTSTFFGLGNGALLLYLCGSFHTNPFKLPLIKVLWQLDNGPHLYHWFRLEL